MSEQEMEKAFAYIRVSGKGQEAGNGFDRQIYGINKFAALRHIHITETFEDVHTGTCDALDRPGFGQMIASLNGVRIIVVERLDRLARSVIVQEQAIMWLAAHKVTLMVADTGENVTEAYMSDPMKRALIQIQAVFAELEKSMLVKKLRIAREAKKRETGRCEGRKPFGAKEGEVGTVSRILDMRKRGCTYREIVDNLNMVGIFNRSGGPWSASTIYNICKRAKEEKENGA